MPGPYVYTVTGSLTNYPSIAAPSSGLITLDDICDTPFSLVVALASQSLPGDYEDTIAFTFPTVTVDPSVCLSEAVYSCNYDSGPYTGVIDLCSDFTLANTIGSTTYNTVANFDSSTGSYTFNTNDKDTFAPGTYQFTITITVGDQTSDVVITFVLTDPCIGATLSEGTNPFNNGPFSYTLNTASPTKVIYDLFNIVTSSTSVNCGAPVIQFYNQGTNTPIDPAVFTQDNAIQSNSEFIIGAGPLTDINKAGTYNLYFTYHYSQSSGNKFTSNAF